MTQSSPPPLDLNGEQEISLLDILLFLKGAYKTVLFLAPSELPLQ